MKTVGGLQDFEYLAIDKQENYYDVYYTIQIDGQTQELVLSVTNQGIISMISDGSFLDDPMAQLLSWSEQLWQEYSGCYFDPDTLQYIYE